MPRLGTTLKLLLVCLYGLVFSVQVYFKYRYSPPGSAFDIVIKAMDAQPSTAHAVFTPLRPFRLSKVPLMDKRYQSPGEIIFQQLPSFKPFFTYRLVRHYSLYTDPVCPATDIGPPLLRGPPIIA